MILLFLVALRVLTMSSRRAQQTETCYIEDVLDQYCVPNHTLTMMALGSSHWSPPASALEAVARQHVDTRDTQRYGNILGMPELRERLARRLESRGLLLEGSTLAVTGGANQAFTNIALNLCDQGDKAVLLCPYYFSHKLALQLAGVDVLLSKFDKKTHKPDWAALEELVASTKPKMLVMTSPSNPSGAVFSASELEGIVALCKRHGTWLVVDQVYYEFLYDGSRHVFPSGYDRIVHIFSLSKSFGMPGWRVGYVVFPSVLTADFRKIQDTNPTHAPIISQKLALECLRVDEEEEEKSGGSGRGCVEAQVRGLDSVREALWDVLGPLGTVRTQGAFYFLVPVPEGVSEQEAVHLLATKHNVLLMLGSPFGAPQHLRLSYGGLPPANALAAVERLRQGFVDIRELAEKRRPAQSL